ncbi:hypothetical protein NMG60_11028474 [Bertholletia excelsa]
MAEEIINTSVNPDVTEPNGIDLKRISVGKPNSSDLGHYKLPDSHRALTGNSRVPYSGKLLNPNNGRDVLPHHMRASTGSFGDLANLSRNSIDKSSSPKSRGSLSPHYMRASTGSCHDFCKYGRKHEFETKERHPIPKRVVRPASSKQNSPEVGVSAEGKIRTGIKPKPSLLCKATPPNSSSLVKQEGPSPSQKARASLRKASSKEKKMVQNGKKSFSGKQTCVEPKTLTVRPSAFPKANEVKLAKSLGTSKVTTKKTPTSLATLCSPKPSIKRVVMNLNVKKSRSPKLLSPLKGQNGIGHAESQETNSKEVVDKTLHVINVETENKVAEPIQDGSVIHSSPSHTFSSTKSLSLPKSPALSLYGEEAEEESETEYTDSDADDSISESSKRVNSGKLAASEANHMRKIQKGGMLLSGDKDSPALSFQEEEAEEESETEFTDTDSLVGDADHSVSETDDMESLDKLETLEGNRISKVQKDGTYLSGDKDCVSVKLKFRRGKVIDLQTENNGPRRLRFRRGRVLRENEDKANVRRRNFRKKVVAGDDGTDPSSEKVVLRHQDALDKRDAQSLFNNVIEETASKLVESRKSKVKALVGAFETVISLQETKPST